jgi:hypothetical protein
LVEYENVFRCKHISNVAFDGNVKGKRSREKRNQSRLLHGVRLNDVKQHSPATQRQSQIRVFFSSPRTSKSSQNEK